MINVKNICELYHQREQGLNLGPQTRLLCSANETISNHCAVSFSW